MKGNIVIRRFIDSDVDDLYQAIHNSLYNSALQKVYDDEQKNLWYTYYSKQYILAVAKMKNIYVAEIDNHVVGSAAIHLDNNMGYVSLVYIDPIAQGKGVGRLLLLALENDEIAKTTKKLCLHAALSSNKFYQKLGYHYVEDKPEIVIDAGLDMIYLEKEL